MFFSIPVAHNSRKYFNFWYDGEIFTHNRLPMGVSISSWVGQQVTSITYSDINLTIFLKLKGLTTNTKAFSYSTVKEFIIIYMDDLLVTTDEDLEDASKIHLLTIEFILYCTKIMGLKLHRIKLY